MKSMATFICGLISVCELLPSVCACSFLEQCVIIYRGEEESDKLCFPHQSLLVVVAPYSSELFMLFLS